MLKLMNWKDGQNDLQLAQAMSDPTLDCSESLRITLHWNPEQFLNYSVSDNWGSFSSGALIMDGTNRVGIAMGNGTGKWLFENTPVLLGANDQQTEGTFIWPTANQSVLESLWSSGEPNDKNGEDHSGFWPFWNNLNDYNVTKYPSMFICQADALLFHYMVVLPESKASNNKQPQIHVTTGQNAFVYVDITYRVESLVFYDNKWLMRDTKLELPMDASRFELIGTGHHRKSIEIQSTHEVTVVLFHMADDHMGSTLVPPVNEMFTQYYILSYSEASVDNQMTVTATVDNTDVTIKLPCNYASYFDITLGSILLSDSIDGNIKHTNLNRGESVTVQSLEDLSGVIVTATYPVVVYVANNKIQTSSLPTTSTDNTLDTVLPISTLSSHYVTFPSVSDVGGGDTPPPAGNVEDFYKFMAVFDNTFIIVHSPTPQVITLEKSGDTQTIILPPSFTYLESDRIFQVIKITNTSDDVCVTTLVPSTLWKSEYDFTVINEDTVFLLIPTEMSQVIVILNGTHTSLSCSIVEGMPIPAYGCSVSLTEGMYNIQTSYPSQKFAAYTSTVVANQYSSCHSLGVSIDVPDAMQAFPTDSYIYSQCGPVSPNVTCTSITGTDVECFPLTTATTEATTESTAQETTSDLGTTLNTISVSNVTSEVSTAETTSDLATTQKTVLVSDVTSEVATPETTSDPGTTQNSITSEVATEGTTQDLSNLQSTQSTLDVWTPSVAMETASSETTNVSDNTVQNTASTINTQSLPTTTNAASGKGTSNPSVSQTTETTPKGAIPVTLATSSPVGQTTTTYTQTGTVDRIPTVTTLPNSAPTSNGASFTFTAGPAPTFTAGPTPNGNGFTFNPGPAPTFTAGPAPNGNGFTFTTGSAPQKLATPTIPSVNMTSLQERCLSLITLMNTLETLTEDEISSLVLGLEEDLKIDVKDTSAYRRSKTSVEDSRVSATMIGTMSLVAVVGFIILLMLSDIQSFLRYICSRDDRSKNNTE